ncbi:DUF177 domain-containing protein [Candidatus Bathyarchaeota archaeon]|nr:DUF177 domain-containing protein [Candidatus Bathyarchaeota archaeon]
MNQPIGYSRVLPFQMDQVDISEDISLINVEGSIDLSRMQDGIRVQAEFNGENESECGRCLEPFIDTIHSEFEEIFLFSNVDATEDEMKIPEDGNIDVEPFFSDYMLMELPISPLCKPDCKGLCDYCGQDLNQAICEHQQEKSEIQIAEISETSGRQTGKSRSGAPKT